MTYATKDQSASDGAPIECYAFTSSFGNFYYTTNNEPTTVDSITFDPCNVSRTDIETGSALDSIATVDVSLPVTEPLVALYCLLKSPLDLKLKIYRVHRGDDFSTQFKIIWQGDGLGSNIDQNYGIIQTGSLIQSKLNGIMSGVIYQRSCNHTLYDERCKVIKDDYTVSATVTKVRGAIITVDDDATGNNLLIGGQISVDRTGEFRGIIDNINNEIRSNYEFIDLKIGDTVKLIHGCDHVRLGDCKNKFDNVINYGGFDFIPSVNPFTELKDKNTAQITTKTYNESIFRGSVGVTHQI